MIGLNLDDIENMNFHYVMKKYLVFYFVVNLVSLTNVSI